MVALQPSHKMSPEPNHDEFARQEFCRTFRSHLLGEIQKGTRTVYEKRVRPKFQKENGRDLKDRHEVRHAMDEDHYYRLYCASLRGAQEMIWDSVIDTVERDLPRLNSTFKGLHNQAKGTLKVDPDLEIPRYHTAADIHLQPGAYHTENTKDDLSAGAVYDRALYVYGDGKFGQYNEAMGHMVIDMIKKTHPTFEPTRILDMGCSVGNSTLPYIDAFPNAEVHGLDVGAPMVRYAHARAEALGKTAHFFATECRTHEFRRRVFRSHRFPHHLSRNLAQSDAQHSQRMPSLAKAGRAYGASRSSARSLSQRSVRVVFFGIGRPTTITRRSRSCFGISTTRKKLVTRGFAKDNVSLQDSPFRWPVLFARK